MASIFKMARGYESLLRRALVRQEDQYRVFLEEMPVVAYVRALDDGAIRWISHKVEKLLDYPPEAFTARPGLFLERVHPGDRERLLRRLGESRRRGHFSAEYRLRDSAGRVRWVRDEGMVARTESGAPLYLQGIWLDVTRHKRTKEVLARQALALSLSNAELKQFAGAASHELRAPARQLVSLGQLLSARCSSQLSEEGLSLLKEIEQAAGRMEERIQGLACYSEAVVARRRPPADASRALKSVLEELKPALEESGATVRFGPLPEEVWISPDLLEKVLRNLIDNGLKFRADRVPEIRVSARREGKFWHLCVTDNGIGMEPNEVTRVFRLFERLRPRQGTGAGLGLAICKKIVETHAGRIWVESRPGEGSAFHFSVPAMPGQAP